MAIIEKRLKYIKFIWNDETQELTIITYRRIQGKTDAIGRVMTGVEEVDYIKQTGKIVLNKTYLFSTMIFMRRIIQRMTRGFPAWIKKRQKKLNG